MPILLKFPSNYNRHPMYNGGTLQWQRKVVIRVQTTNQPDAQSNANPNRYPTTKQHAAASKPSSTKYPDCVSREIHTRQCYGTVFTTFLVIVPQPVIVGG